MFLPSARIRADDGRIMALLGELGPPGSASLATSLTAMS